MVDTEDLKSSEHSARGGSNPPRGTIKKIKGYTMEKFFIEYKEALIRVASLIIVMLLVSDLYLGMKIYPDIFGELRFTLTEFLFNATCGIVLYWGTTFVFKNV